MGKNIQFAEPQTASLLVDEKSAENVFFPHYNTKCSEKQRTIRNMKMICIQPELGLFVDKNIPNFSIPILK